jgi:hypothetical protein
VQVQGGGHFYAKIVKTLDFTTYTVVYDGSSDPANREGIRLCKFGTELNFLAGGKQNIAIISLQGVVQAGSIPQPAIVQNQEYASHGAIYPIIIDGKLYYDYLGFTSECYANPSQVGVPYDNGYGSTRIGQRFGYGRQVHSRSHQFVTL